MPWDTFLSQKVHVYLQTLLRSAPWKLPNSVKNNAKLDMWANAQRDGRPAEYRWRPLFNAAKFG